MPKSSKDGESYPFIKKLAANDRPTRDSALASLNQFLRAKRKLDEFELQKLWKGLFYSMWFSDRPKTQQRLADDLANLLDVIDEANFFNFVDAFWVIMAREWDGIDKHRIDKFYLLMRRYVASMLRRMKKEQWGEKWLQEYQRVFGRVPLNISDLKIPNALRLHIDDIFVDELEKIIEADQDSSESEELNVSDVPFNQLLGPFFKLATECPLKFIREHTMKYVLQDSRLVAWGAVEDTTKDEQSEERSDDEWGGFDD
jgi:ribosomal RNA-processing protein 1